jgi:hypothetical protein
MKLIGLTAYAKSGKSTAADFLKEQGFVEVALAGKLKDVCSQVFRVPREDFDDQSKKEVPFIEPLFIYSHDIARILDSYILSEYVGATQIKHVGIKLISPRHIAQYIGTEVLRDIDPNIHVKAAARSLDPKGKYVFSDVRFPNEASFIKESGGKLIGIKRDLVFPNNLSEVHESETYIAKLLYTSDILLENNGTMDDFESQVLNLTKEL